MAKKLIERIFELEQKIYQLEAKILDLTSKTDNKRQKPESVVSILDLGRKTPMPSSWTGLGKVPGRQGNVIWNNSDAGNTPFGQQPLTPARGYNKHSHSRYAGGALDINTLELIEYENTDGIILDLYGNPVNKHCQGYWKYQPKIKKTEGGIEKIGLLDIEFDEENQKWIASGATEINVEETNLVQYDEGEIKLDGFGNEMIAPMYGTEENTRNVVWDRNARCWRFYAVYAD